MADLVYHPLDTALLRAAQAAGAHAVDGLGMLVHQAVRQQELWTGVCPTRRCCAPPQAELGGWRGGSVTSPGASFPDGGRVARAGARRDRRGAAGGAGDHGRGDPGRDGAPPARLRARPAPALRGRRADARRRRPSRPHARLAGGDRDQEQRVVPQRQVARGDVAGARARRRSPLTQVRPGHADLAGMQKYGFTDARDVLERASARETAARVAAGAVAKKLLCAPRRRGHLARDPDGLVRVGPDRTTDAGRSRIGRRVAGALLRSAPRTR